MPLYIIHGFKWPRPLVRAWCAGNGLEEATPDWVHTGSPSSAIFLASFHNTHPKLAQQFVTPVLLEEYDPLNIEYNTSPHLFVARKILFSSPQISLANNKTPNPLTSLVLPKDFANVVAKETKKVESSFLELRESTGKPAGKPPEALGMDMGVFVVWCGDEIRAVYDDEEPKTAGHEVGEEGEDEEEEGDEEDKERRRKVAEILGKTPPPPPPKSLKNKDGKAAAGRPPALQTEKTTGRKEVIEEEGDGERTPTQTQGQTLPTNNRGTTAGKEREGRRVSGIFLG